MWERVELNPATLVVKIGYGAIKIPSGVFDAKYVSVEADRDTLQVRLTPEKRQGVNVYKMRHKSYNGIAFSKIAVFLSLRDKPAMVSVPHKVEDGKLILDLSEMEKRNK